MTCFGILAAVRKFKESIRCDGIRRTLRRQWAPHIVQLQKDVWGNAISKRLGDRVVAHSVMWPKGYYDMTGEPRHIDGYMQQALHGMLL